MAGPTTKREKKAAKFRAKKAHGEGAPPPPESSDNDASGASEPAAEADATTEAMPSEGPPTSPEPSVDGSPTATTATTAMHPKKKRKRASAQPVEGATRTVFDEDGVAKQVAVAPPPGASSAPKLSQKYIVFVGNMAYDVTADMLAQHFSATCGETPQVRLLTKRADPSALDALSNSKKKSIAKGKARDPSAPQSKGCAFVEFSSPDALQKGLRFHHSQFHGRQINVELTAGGGGQSAQRKEKIKAKNAELDKERKKHFEKHVRPQVEAHQRKQTEARASEAAGAPPSRKRSKFASGANAVRLG